MSESNEHRNMVLAMAETLRLRYPNAQIISDVQEQPDDPVPPIIQHYRPDIWIKNGDTTLIGEAKTGQDIESKRSLLQIKTFIQHAEKQNGYFILGAYGQAANSAKTVLRFIYQELQIEKCQFEVFDGLDYWMLKKEGIYSWHLI